MALQFVGSDGQPISELRFDAIEAVTYKQFSIQNPGAAVVGTQVVAVEAGVGKSDASQLGNRTVLTFASSLVNGSLAVGPISVFQSLSPANLTFHLVDGMLQLSSDSFSWGDYISIGAIGAGASSTVYAKYNKALLGLSTSPPTFITRMTITNISVSSITGIILSTADMNTTLSLDGINYSTSVTAGTITAGSSSTVWVKTTSITQFPYANLNASDTTNPTTDSTSIPFLVAGGRFYCTIQEIKDYLQGIDVSVVTSDEEVTDLIQHSSQGIDRATRRRFDMVTATERYDGVGQQKLVLDNYPIIAVQEVAIYDLNNALAHDIKSTDTNFSSELIIDYGRGFLTLPPAAFPYIVYPPQVSWFWPASSISPLYSERNDFDYQSRFGAGTTNIAVTYTYGYQTPPEEIRDACKKLVCIELLKKKGSTDSQGLANVSIAGMGESFTARGTSGGTGPYGHMIAELQQDVDAALEMFRKRRWLTV